MHAAARCILQRLRSLHDAGDGVEGDGLPGLVVEHIGDGGGGDTGLCGDICDGDLLALLHGLDSSGDKDGFIKPEIAWNVKR